MLDEWGPQPYGELFIMRADGRGVRQLTDNQWEDAAPAWRPEPRPRGASDRERIAGSDSSRGNIPAKRR